MKSIIQPYNYHLSGAFSHDTLLLYYSDLIYTISGEHPFSFVSGSVPCKWNSGRIVSCTSNDYLFQCLEEYTNRNINVFFTFSNYLLEQEDLCDHYCNYLLDLISDYRGGVIVASDDLARYIKDKYPSVRVYASILRSVYEIGKRTKEYYESLTSLYDYIVLHPDDIVDYQLLDRISNKHQYEIIVNEECTYQCQFRRQHDDLICGLYLGKGTVTRKMVQEFENINCPTLRPDFIYCKKSAIPVQQLSKYASIGYNNFKIQGRANSPMLFLYDLCSYSVIEDYRRTIYKNIANRFTFNSKKEKLRIWKV